MLTIEKIENPKYTNEIGDTILVSVKFAEFDEVLDFGANAHDPTEHGQEIYKRIMAGEFGPIAEYVPPVATEPQPISQGAQTL
jgi:hypothetical protein